MRHRILTVAFLVAATAGVAHAKRVPLPPAPSPVQVTSASPLLGDYITARGAGLTACAGRATAPISARVAISWNRAGRTQSVVVRGGSARFRRCATTMLRGVFPQVSARGRAQAMIVVTTADATSSTPSASALDTCVADADCTIYFRTSGCVPADPLPVATTSLAAAKVRFPLRMLACGMGGPQYDKLRSANEHRYSTRCVQRTCTLIDHGVQDTDPLDGLRVK